MSNHRKTGGKALRILFFAISAAALALSVWLAVALFRPLFGGNDPRRIRQFLDDFGPAGRLVFVGLQMLQVVLAWIPGEAVEVAAGYVYGTWEGTVLCLLGCAAASAVVFFGVRRFGAPLIRSVFRVRRMPGFLESPDAAASVLFLLFLLPGTPKDLLTYLAGLTAVRPKTFLALSLTARVPSVLSSAYAGEKLGEGDLRSAAAVFAFTALLGAAGFLLYRKLAAAPEKATAPHERESAR